jgi:hypothetical protein
LGDGTVPTFYKAEPVWKIGPNLNGIFQSSSDLTVLVALVF